MHNNKNPEITKWIFIECYLRENIAYKPAYNKK